MRVADSTSVASRIEQAFQSASTSTGTSFDYLVKTAERESSFNTTAKAKTSTATGLFQFIESTWLETMKEAGPEFGLSKYADQIERTRSGKYRVADPAMRREILDLRKDPEISSLMAGALTQKNANHMSSRLGREPTEGELYMAHFLGATGANRLINAAQDRPNVDANSLFPAQAKANKAIFYNRDGSARTAAEVYDVIVSKHDAVTMIASVTDNPVSAVPTAKPQMSPMMLAQLDAQAVPVPKPAPAPVPADANTSVVARSDPEPAAPIPATPVPASLANSEPNPVPGNPSVVAKSGAAPADPASERVLSAWRATETSNPFEALFRDNGNDVPQRIGASFLSAFSAKPNEPLFSALNEAASQVAVQIAAGDREGPLDLTRFLNYRDRDEQKDLLPPA